MSLKPADRAPAEAEAEADQKRLRETIERNARMIAEADRLIAASRGPEQPPAR